MEACPVFNPFRHALPEGFQTIGRAIATQDPDDIAVVAVALAEEPPIGIGVLVGENDLYPSTPGRTYLVGPGWQQANIETMTGGRANDKVDVLEIGIVGRRGI